MKHEKNGDLVIGASILLCSLFFVFYFARINFEVHHTGLVYRTALDVACGKLLFRDTFTKYGALAALFDALGILLLGRRVTSILWVSAFFYAATYVLFYLLARRTLPRALSLALTLVAVFLAPFYFWDYTPWSSIPALFFQLLTLYLLLTAQRRSHHFAAGVTVTLAFFCRQPVGITLTLAVLFAFLLAREHVRRVLSFLLGLLSSLAVFLIPFALLGILDDFYAQSILGMFQTAVDPALVGNGIFGTLRRMLYCLFVAPITAGSTPFSAVFLLLPLSSLALFLLTLFKKEKGDSPRQSLYLAMIALSAWHQFYPVPCERHFYWGALPSLLSLGILLYAACRRLPRHRSLALALSLSLLFCVPTTYRVAKGIEKADTRAHIYYKNEAFPHLDGLLLRPAVAGHFDAFFENVTTLRARFPARNIINLTQNEFYGVVGDSFLPLYDSPLYYNDYQRILLDYIDRYRPIVIANAPPREDYVLFATAVGDHNDDWFDYHDLPANLFVPLELLE